MPVAGGPNTLGENNLVFAYDTGDVSNSYIGEPTANLIPSPGLNALPTFGNSWGTYNTNQYCGNNGCGVYWNLATVSGISSNIVTTSTAHGLRTFDVINPETTGGGVTSGTQYFVKAISSTQFTLHAYNGSQDGSQGYISLATGAFKVHDSIALDQRISINASSFPTKWFGNPHQPNSGLVKEIIPNGYRNPYTGKLTDCIRLHVPRVDGVDGMAYGSDASVTIGQSVTTTFWLRAVNAAAVGKYVSFQHYNYGGPGGATVFYGGGALGAVGEWRAYTITFTPTHNTLISYWFPDGGAVYDLDLANIQVEQKNHATQFIAGTRSATQGLLPVIGNSTIDLTNVSFNSNAQMVFDGTNDYVDCGAIQPFDLSARNVTWEAVVKFNDTSGVEAVITRWSNSIGTVWWFGRYPTTKIHLAFIINGSYYDYYSNGDIGTTPGYHHIVATLNNTVLTYYINGVLDSTDTVTAGTWTSDSDPSLIIGAQDQGAAANINGEIPVAKIYNRALTAQEIKQNYQQYKTRFNLS